MKIKAAPKNRTFLVVLGAFLLLALLLILGGRNGKRNTAAENAATREARVEFLRNCGWEADPDSEQVQQIQLPEHFSDVFASYNELQRQQGYDLEPYAGQDCMLYTYAVTNWPDETQTVLTDLYVYNDRVIGGDVHSTELNGFMIGLK